MNFYNRHKIYFILIISLLCIIPILILYFSFMSPGLNIESNLNLDVVPNLDINLENNSSHIIENITILINNKLVNKIDVLYPNDKNNYNYLINEDNIVLTIYSKQHRVYSREYKLNKSQLNQNILEYSPTYFFNKINKVSDFNLEICNSYNSENYVVEIITDGELISKNAKKEVNINKDECINLEYNIIFNTQGSKKIKFKIYNDVYVKELLISGNVN